MIQKNNNDCGFDINAIANGGLLEQFSIGLKENFWTEMLFLSDNKIIKTLYNLVSNPEYKNKFIFEAINEIAPKFPIKATHLRSPIRKVNNIKIFKRIQNK